MKVKELLNHWEQNAKAQMTSREYSLRLPLEDAARILALAEMYPKRREEDLIRELLASALDELESGLPYIAGQRVIAEDELGDPLYEDVGPTPRFLDLSKKYLEQLKGSENPSLIADD